MNPRRGQFFMTLGGQFRMSLYSPIPHRCPQPPGSPAHFPTAAPLSRCYDGQITPLNLNQESNEQENAKTNIHILWTSPG